MVKKDSWDELLKDMENSECEAQLFIGLFQAEQSRFKEGKWDLRFTNLENHLNEYQVWNKDSAHDKKMDKLLRLLYTCPYRDRKDRNRKRVSGTCEWFTHHQGFQEWDQSEESRLLWVSADPGCGKSVLARYLVDEVLPRPKDRTVCYFFFKDDFEDQRTATAALSSLIRQLLLGQPSLLSEAILKQAATDGEKLPHSFQDLWEIFKAIISSPSMGEIVFVIDALDECQDTDRRHFIDSVTELYLKPDNSRTPKFLMTSRPYLKIEDGFHRLRTKVPIIRLNGEDEENIEKIAKEINLVVQDLTQTIAAEKNLEPDEHGFLQEQLAKIPNQTYLWVTLTLEYIAKTPGFTKGNVRRCLSTEIPPDVNQAYEKILNRSTNYTKARLMLHIILAAKMPLSLEELSVSLALNGTNQSADQLKEEMEPPERFKRTVRDLCGLMLHLNNGKVYLLHQTVKEFLVGNSPSGHPTWQNSFLQNASEKLLAKRCIWMLHLGPSDPNLTHLNRYAARYWSEHFRGFDSCKEDKITSLALQLCDPDSRKFRDWNPTLCRTWNHKDENQAFSTSLMVASCLGLEGVVEKLLSDQSVDISLNSPRGDMPAIRFAVYEGHHAVVKRLLDSGQVDVNLRDRDQQTLLSLAASRGHEATVTLLLKTKNVIVDSQDFQYRTPLSHAAANGREGAVKLLLEDSRVNPNLKDRKEQAPLLNAAKSRRTGVAKLLLKNFRVDVNTTDQEQRTPLSHAAENGDEAMVKLLLRHEKVKPDLPDHWDVTPLAYAAEYGQSAIIKPLFETGLVDVNSKSKDDKTPLLFAIFSGSAATVRQLLETRQVDLDVTDQRDRTALDLARLHCRDDIADILLGLDADTSGVGSVGAADLLSNGRSNEAHRTSGVKQDTITHP
ncbi:hypothetical protein N7475_007490 [Penicillium sp. IBT 31633x]|nr:hypothetical protein N7475_007490 [Penicillium sp. IBT 31633x]